MQSKLTQVLWYELKRNFQRRGYLFVTFGLPIIAFLLVTGYNAIQVATADDPDAEAQTDEDRLQEIFDPEGIQVAGYVDQSGAFATVPASLQAALIPYDSEEAARQAMQSGEIDVFYVIDEAFFETRQVVLHLPGLAIAMLNDQLIERLVLTTVADDVPVDQLARLANPANLIETNLARDAQATQNEDADFLMIYVFAIVFMLAIFLTNNYLLQTVTEEKETRLVEILVSSVRPAQLLLGKIIALSALGLLQIVVWLVALILLVQYAQSLSAFASLSALAGITLPLEQLPVMVAFFLLGYLMFAGFYGAIGAMFNNMREGQQYSVVVVLPTVIPFYFLTVFIEQPNSPLAVGLSIFPLTAPLSMVMRLSVTTVPLIEIIISLALLALTAAAAMWGAGRLFRVNTLLAGNPPKLKDIPRLIFG